MSEITDSSSSPQSKLSLLQFLDLARSSDSPSLLQSDDLIESSDSQKSQSAPPGTIASAVGTTSGSGESPNAADGTNQSPTESLIFLPSPPIDHQHPQLVQQQGVQASKPTVQSQTRQLLLQKFHQQHQLQQMQQRPQLNYPGIYGQTNFGQQQNNNASNNPTVQAQQQMLQPQQIGQNRSGFGQLHMANGLPVAQQTESQAQLNQQQLLAQLAALRNWQLGMTQKDLWYQQYLHSLEQHTTQKDVWYQQYLHSLQQQVQQVLLALSQMSESTPQHSTQTAKPQSSVEGSDVVVPLPGKSGSKDYQSEAMNYLRAPETCERCKEMMPALMRRMNAQEAIINDLKTEFCTALMVCVIVIMFIVWARLLV